MPPHPLLELQRLDLYAAALRERRAGLPERAASAEREAEIARGTVARADVGTRRDALAREERRLEALVADLGSKTKGVETKLYSGEVKAIKELEALQLELRECRRRLSEQEDAELVLLEQEERVDAEAAAIDARSELLRGELRELRAAIAAVEKDIDAELARIESERRGVAARVEESVLKSYERLRAAPPLRGQAVAEIAKGSCSGCRTTLPIAFASTLPEAGATVLCPRCGRILVV